MANQTPASMTLEECSQFISSFESFQTSVAQDPTRWRHTIGLLVREASRYAQVSHDKEKLQNRLDEALNQIQQGIGVQQGAQQVYLQRIQDLEERLRQVQLADSSSFAPRAHRSPKHPDPESFDGDKTKLDPFFINLHLKFHRNEDHFVQKGQNTEYNKLVYAVSLLRGDAFAQIEPFVIDGRITIKDIRQFMEILRVRFGEVDPVNTAKHEFYKLRQANKDLEVFLNTFLRLQNKAQIADEQALDHLYEKLSDEVKAQLVPFPRKKNLSVLVQFLQEMDSNQKIFAKSSYRGKDATTTSASVPKPPLKTSSSAPVKPSASVAVSIAAPALSTATGTHPGPMDVSTIGKRGPISQEEKDRRNRLGLCRYCGEAGHIAIDHRNPELLASKRRAAGITNHSMALVPYTPPPAEEKGSSLS